MQLIRTNSENRDFIQLVNQLDAEIRDRNMDNHEFYAHYNKIDKIKHVVLIYENKIAVGCGAIKFYDENTMEVKRMYTRPLARGKGVASMVLKELERWASELHFKNCILETGVKHEEAIGLYKKKGYRLIPNYGQYVSVETSVCFFKEVA